MLYEVITEGLKPGAKYYHWERRGVCARVEVGPRDIEKRSATEGTRNVVVATNGGTTATFTGLGRLSGGGITQIDFSNATGTCEHLDVLNGTMRCMRVLLSPGGEARMCDPKA